MVGKAIQCVWLAISLLVLGLSLKVFWWSDSWLSLSTDARIIGYTTSNSLSKSAMNIGTAAYDVAPAISESLGATNRVLYVAQNNLNQRLMVFNNILWRRTGELTTDTSRVADAAQGVSDSLSKVGPPVYDSLAHFNNLADQYKDVGVIITQKSPQLFKDVHDFVRVGSFIGVDVHRVTLKYSLQLTKPNPWYKKVGGPVVQGGLLACRLLC